jgi:hypothetical protein
VSWLAINDPRSDKCRMLLNIFTAANGVRDTRAGMTPARSTARCSASSNARLRRVLRFPSTVAQSQHACRNLGAVIAFILPPQVHGDANDHRTRQSAPGRSRSGVERLPRGSGKSPGNAQQGASGRSALWRYNVRHRRMYGSCCGGSRRPPRRREHGCIGDERDHRQHWRRPARWRSSR